MAPERTVYHRMLAQEREVSWCGFVFVNRFIMNGLRPEAAKFRSIPLGEIIHGLQG